MDQAFSAWSVYFPNGSRSPFNKGNPTQVRAVRTAFSGSTVNGEPLQTEQTTCFDASALPTGCAGTGQDGELQTGLARTYVDNGDGTITDQKTGLVWEKLTDDGSIHDRDRVFDWPRAFSDKIGTLNLIAFTGHTDWRLPNIDELQSLLSYSGANPLVDAAFDTGCTPGCTAQTCSCTSADQYWSATTDSLTSTVYAWVVLFNNGLVDSDVKGDLHYARAVRGG